MRLRAAAHAEAYRRALYERWAFLEDVLKGW